MSLWVSLFGKEKKIVKFLPRLNAPQISRMSPLIPDLRRTLHHFLSIRNHMAQIPLALTLQPLVPQIGSVCDDPVEALLDDPIEIRSVVVLLCRLAVDETV
jgi:hypothetical protein